MPVNPLDLTEAMVRINSVLPHEQLLAEFLADQIRALGLEPVWQDVAPGRPNVSCLADLSGSGPFVTFTGHLDTVAPVEGWSSDPWTPVRRDGRLYGLGALDMKSGLACAFTAFARLLQAPHAPDGPGRLGFAATCDEEGLGSGARALMQTRMADSDLILLPEPFGAAAEEDPSPLALPGKILYRIVVQGRSAHALIHPEHGINAVDDAARIVGALERLPLGVHPLLGTANYCTLKIEGGYREYSVVVPERCEIIVTRMLVPGETRDGAVEQLRRLIGSLGLDSAVSIETPPPSYQPYVLAADAPAVRAFERAFASVHGRAPILRGMMVITDGNIYGGEAGIPTISCGPRGRGLHEADEYVEIDSLEPCVAVLMGTALAFSGSAADRGGSGRVG